ncbi:MAG: hypothetical protein JRJ19_16620, partial [Deltaproteobacteria bacterium]|nr:hypothetical protein [Deltaproteobacteria bacterium]
MRLKQLAPVSYLVALTVLYSLTLIPGNVSAQGRMIRMVVGEQKSMKYTGIDKVIV